METLNKKENKNNQNSQGKFIAVGLSILSLLIGFTGGYIVKTLMDNNSESPLAKKMSTCYSVLKANWLYGTDENTINQAVSELMYSSSTSIDPYTFITPTEEDQNLSLSSVGFGFQLVSIPSGYLLEKVFSDGPLATSGAQKDDIITKVSVSGTTYDFVGKSYAERSSYMDLAKKAGKADFHILRGEETIILSDVIASSFNQDVAYKVDEYSYDKTLTIKIDSFLGEDDNLPSKVLSNILSENSDIETLVLDLRDNGGGYVDEVTNIASLFTPKDKYIFFAKNRDDGVIAASRQIKNPTYEGIDIKILQNGMTASASESLALSLKQNNNATVYGFKSYGKGIAQTFYQFEDKSVLRYTYAKMFGPDGRTSIHSVGLTPDVNSSTYGLKEYPYNYSSYILTSGNYSSNLNILSSFLIYLDYDFESTDSMDKLLSEINKFQEEHGYNISTSYSEEITQQLHYEIYKTVEVQNEEELKAVVGL